MRRSQRELGWRGNQRLLVSGRLLSAQRATENKFWDGGTFQGTEVTV